jgi:hypothetical protein
MNRRRHWYTQRQGVDKEGNCVTSSKNNVMPYLEYEIESPEERNRANSRHVVYNKHTSGN